MSERSALPLYDLIAIALPHNVRFGIGHTRPKEDTMHKQYATEQEQTDRVVQVIMVTTARYQTNSDIMGYAHRVRAERMIPDSKARTGRK